AVALCDPNGGLVLEVTPRNVVARPPQKGLCSCTNMFVSKELSVAELCHRYEALEKAAVLEKLTVKEGARLMHGACQEETTIHTVVFEPAALRIHVAMGKAPSSALPLKEIDLKSLLKAN